MPLDRAGICCRVFERDAVSHAYNPGVMLSQTHVFLRYSHLKRYLPGKSRLLKVVVTDSDSPVKPHASYMHNVCVCVCACMRVRMCVIVCVCACVYVRHLVVEETFIQTNVSRSVA